MSRCMCGDPYCPSCGPAQGNYKCPQCGQWSEDGGCVNPEMCEAAQRQADDEYAQQLEEEERIFQEAKANGYKF